MDRQGQRPDPEGKCFSGGPLGPFGKCFFFLVLCDFFFGLAFFFFFFFLIEAFEGLIVYIFSMVKSFEQFLLFSCSVWVRCII